MSAPRAFALLACLGGLAAEQALAQQPPRLDVGPEIFGEDKQKEKERPREGKRQEADPFATALYDELEPADWTQLGLSSSTPKDDLTRILRSGVYRLELVTLSLLAKRGQQTLTKLLDRREEGETLRSIAESVQIDYDALYDESSKLKRRLDREAAEIERLLQKELEKSTSTAEGEAPTISTVPAPGAPPEIPAASTAPAHFP